MNDILIIGGMGPRASLLLHERLLTYASEHGAKSNDQYPFITHISLAIPDFISDTSVKECAMEQIRRRLECLWRP